MYMVSVKANICKERGVALLIVTLMVVMMSMLVMQISHSTFLHGRSIGLIQRNVQAEYLLKSALNIGAAMIQNDETPYYDSITEDVWGRFSTGLPIPEEILAQVGINYPGVEVSMEIMPEDAKINIATSTVRDSGSGSTSETISLAQYFTKKLFENLGFNGPGDLFDIIDTTGPIRRQFTSAQLTSNLIDFYDDNNESFTTTEPMSDGDKLPDGIEGDLPENYFPEKGKKPGSLEMRELLLVPGMTPLRLQALMPFARVKGRFEININIAPIEVLRSISNEIDDTFAQSIIDYRNNEGPFKDLTPLEDFGPMNPITRGALSVSSKHFDFIAKVRFGDTKSFFIQARIEKGASPAEPAIIQSITMY